MIRALVLALVFAACIPASAGASSGAWDRAFGQGVNPAGPDTGICTVAADCHLGSAADPGGAVFPQDVATGPDGSVYVAELSPQRVQKFDAQGHFLLAWGKDVIKGNVSTGFEVCTVAADCKWGAAGTAGGEFNLPDGIATDAQGHVYVSDKSNDRIQEFSSDGAFMRAAGQDVSTSKTTDGLEICDVASDCKAGTATGQTGGVLFFPQDVAVGTDGRVYIASGYRRIEVLKPDLSFDRAWGADVVNNGGANTGFEVCTVDTQCKTGEIGTGRGGEVAVLGSVATGPSGDVYVFEANRFRVERFSADGAFNRAWGEDVNGAGTGFGVCTVAASCQTGVTGFGDGAFRSPNDMVAPAADSVAVDPSETVYVADRENDRVQAFSEDGQFLRTWGTDVDANNGTTGFEICTNLCGPGSEQQEGGSLVKPTGIAASPAGDIYTADQTGGRVQRFTCGPSTVAFGSATATVAEGAGTAHLTVNRSGDSGCGVQLHYATANGSAVAGSDYADTHGTLTFGIGDTSRTIDVPITDDAAREGDETFSATLDTPLYPATVGSPATTTVTITDDDLIDTAITSGPVAPTNDRTPTFTFSADPPAGATFECSLDGAAFAACDTPYTTPSLADGSHRLRVRATSPGSGPDGSPATRDFSVDTVAPNTVIALVPQGAGSGSISDGELFGTVAATADEQDPPPGVGNGVTRCVLDPPAPPAAYDDLPVGACPSPTTAALGTHTFYAASLDQAFNVGPVVSKTFRILPAPPDTIIDSGPSGGTFLLTPYFGFHSTIAGSTFECRIDSAAFSKCTNPFLSASLSGGNHSFEVRAKAANGTVDPTPAHRDFSIGSASGRRADCEVRPFLHLSISDDHAWICSFYPSRAVLSTNCGFAVVCVVKDLDCPMFTECTVTTKAQWFDADHSTYWFAVAYAFIGHITGSGSGSDSTCRTGKDGDRCFATANYTSLVVPDPRPGAEAGVSHSDCYAALDVTKVNGDRGSDSIRRLECDGQVEYKPVAALQAVGSGSSIQLVVPGAGTVTIGPGDASRRVVARAARAKPAFRKSTKKVKKAGVVTFKPKLGKAAQRTLRRRGRVKLKVRVAYSSPGGTHKTRTTKVTLKKPHKPGHKLPRPLR